MDTKRRIIDRLVGLSVSRTIARSNIEMTQISLSGCQIEIF